MRLIGGTVLDSRNPFKKQRGIGNERKRKKKKRLSRGDKETRLPAERIPSLGRKKRSRPLM
jgi:hypothetical protein